MAKRIIWSRQAQRNRKEILEYWNERNKSKQYSRLLNDLFINAVNMLSDFPK